ncbi:MAG TPA: T9SS type A sorting domain-containing protein [Ignavibacteria bacterium]|nr:T9SS type A sorting domain-containing protein [Ignavibacteria bacterium]
MKRSKLFFSIFFFTLLFFTDYSLSDPSQGFVWIEQNSGTTNDLMSVHSIDGINVWVCGLFGTVLKSTNRGVTWVRVGNNGIPSNSLLFTIAGFSGSEIALTAGLENSYTTVYRTSDGGANWTQVFSQNNGFINSIYFKPDMSEGYMMGDPVGGRWSLWKTTDTGLHWDSTGLYLTQDRSEAGWFNSFFSINNQIWFGTSNSRIYHSTDFGITWEAQAIPGEFNSNAIWFCGLGEPDELTGFAGGFNLYKTTNSGTNWISQSSPGTYNFQGFTGGPNILTDNSAGNLFRFFVRYDNKIYQNDGNIWYINYTAPGSGYRYMSSDNSGLHFWAVRDNGGISYLDLPVGIAQNGSEVPLGFSLNQNYPNPFNPGTIINYKCSMFNFISLKVYDALGNELAVLVNENKPAGSYEVEFSTASSGMDLSSGIYFYSLYADGVLIDTKRMVLLK